MSDEQDYQDYLDEQDYQNYLNSGSDSPAPDAPVHTGPEASWLDTIANSLALSVPVAARTAGAGIDFVEDQTTGTHYGDQFMSDAERMINETNQRLNFAPNSNKQIASGLISGAPAFFGTMAVAPGALPIYFAGDTFFNKRRDLDQRGASPYEANMGAAAEGALAYLTAKPLPGLFGGSAAAPVRRLVGGAGTMGALSIPQTLTDIAVDKYALDEMPTREEFGDRLLTGVKGGVAGGVLYGGVMEGAARVGARGAQRARAGEVESLMKQIQQVDEGAPTKLFADEPAIKPVDMTQPDIIPPESGVITPEQTPARIAADRVTAEQNARVDALEASRAEFPETRNEGFEYDNRPAEGFEHPVDGELSYPADEMYPVTARPAWWDTGPAKAEPKAPIVAEAPPSKIVAVDDQIGEPGEFPVRQIPPSAIATRPEDMQFKKSDNKENGTNATDEIVDDKWKPIMAGNFLLWEPVDKAAYGLTPEQPYIVVDGHHRLDFAKKMGEPTVNAQIMREADGHSISDAVAQGAEKNIAVGGGTVYDQVKYFGNTARTHGKDAAVARARSLGAKSRQAQTIAFASTDNTYTSFINERITPQQAEAIAKTAPGNKEAQQIGLKEALDEKHPATPGQIRGAIESSLRNKAAGGDVQTDAFGTPVAGGAIASHREIGNLIDDYRKTLQREIDITGGVKRNPGVAKKYGFPAKDPGALPQINKMLRGEMHRWDDFNTHPDLKARIDQMLPVETYDPLAFGKGTATVPVAAEPRSVVAERKAATEPQRELIPALNMAPEVVNNIEVGPKRDMSRWSDEEMAAYQKNKYRDRSIWPIEDLLKEKTHAENYLQNAKDMLADVTKERQSRVILEGEKEPLRSSKQGIAAIEGAIKRRSEEVALINEALSEVDATPADPSLLKLTLANEEGAIRIGKLQTPQGVQEVYDSPDAKFFGPKLRGAFRKWFIMPQTLAEKFPAFKPIYEAYVNENKTQARTANDLAATLRPYLDLLDTTRVDNLLEASRLASHASGQRTPLAPDRLARMGFSPEESAAFFSVRDAMDQSLDVLRKSFLIRAKGDVKKGVRINAYVDALAQHDYVPFGRFGEFFTSATDKTGKTLEFSMHKTRKEALLASGDLRTRLLEQFSPSDIDVKFGKLNKLPNEAYDALPHDMASGLFFLDDSNATNKLPPRGFSAHFMEAKLTPGYEQDFKRSIASYVSGIAKYAAKSESAPKYKRGLEDILEASHLKSETAGDNKLYSYAKKYVDDVNSPTKANRTLATFMYHYYLGGNAKSALVNLTQPFTVTLPSLKTITKSPTLVFAKAMKQAGEYGLNREAFTKKNPELALALKRANDNGVIGDQAFRQMFDLAKQLPSNKPSTTATLSKLSTFMFDKAESFNRVHAFLAGYEGGKRQGQSGTMLQKTAEDFVTRTQFDYGTGGRPEIIRNHPNAFIFRLWTANYLANAMKAAGHSFGPKGLYGAAKFAAPMLALSGAAGFPLINLILKAAETSGVDPKKEVRKELNSRTLGGYGGEVADALIYGLPSLSPLKTNIGGSIGLGNVSPDLEEGLGAAMGRLALGVLVDPAQRVDRAYDIVNKGGSYGRAAEALLPEGARSLSKAARYAVNGVTSPDGTPQVPRNKVGLRMIAKTAAGLTDTDIAKGFEKTHSEYVITEERSARTARLNRASAEAALKFTGGNVEALWGTPAGKQILEDLVQQNADSPPEYQVYPDEGAIKKRILQMLAPDAAMLLRTAKPARKAVAEVMRNVR